jgi:hypothetical protein
MPKPNPPAPSADQRVVDLLRGLNQAADEQVLRRMALSLQLTARFGAVADLPLARDSGSKAAQRELIELARLAEQFRTHIAGMHSTAHRAWEEVEPLDERPPNRLHPLVLAYELLELREAALIACTRLSDTPPHKGNRQKRQAHEITRQACAIYTQLTGKTPGRVTDAYQEGPSPGPCEEFLAAIFKALSIPASADSQLRLFLASSRPME